MSVIEFLSQPVWQRLGLTLLHFLWQGLAIAVLFGLIIRLLRLNRGNNQYIACLLAFLVMIACPVATFLTLDIPTESLATPIATQVITEPIVSSWDTLGDLPVKDVEAGTSVASPETAEPISSIPLRERIAGYLQTSLPWAISAWLVGVFVLSIRLLMGFAGVYRWRRGLEPLPDNPAQRVSLLAKRIGLRGIARVFVSPCAVQAVAIGYFRPMVLLPAAMVTQMPPDMLEAVIAHELAHIRRFDLWVNLLQRVAETLLFYHPAVWWLSNRLRSERELCCDELAIRATGQRLTYASTLEHASRTEFISKRPALAVGLGRDRKPTLNRIRHILGLTPTQRNCPFWLAGVISVVFLAAIAIPTALALSSMKEHKPSLSGVRQIVMRNETLVNPDVEVKGESTPRMPATKLRSPHGAGGFLLHGAVRDIDTGRMIGEAKVEDDGYGGNEGAVAGSNGPYEYWTWAEEHFVKASAPGYESKRILFKSSLMQHEMSGQLNFELKRIKRLEYSLRPVKKVWRAGENPAFVLDVRNVSSLPGIVGQLNLLADGSRPISKSFGALRLLFAGNDKKSFNPNVRYCPVFTEPYDKPAEVAPDQKISLKFEMTEMAELHSPKLKQSLTPGRYVVGMGYLDNHQKAVFKTNFAEVEILPAGVADKKQLKEFFKPYDVSGTKIHAGFIPAATSAKLGDPVNISFVVENLTDAPYMFAFGGDYRATARHDRFKIMIYDEHGQLLEDPKGNQYGIIRNSEDPAYWRGGGRGLDRTVHPRDMWTEVVNACDFRKIEKPGIYDVKCAFMLMPSRQEQDSEKENVLVKSSFKINILPAVQVESEQIGSKLEFRVAPGNEDVTETMLKDYVADLAENGPVAARKRNDKFAWFEVREGTTFNNLITGGGGTRRRILSDKTKVDSKANRQQILFGFQIIEVPKTEDNIPINMMDTAAPGVLTVTADMEHYEQLLELSKNTKGASVLFSPRILTNVGEQAQVNMMSDVPYVSGYEKADDNLSEPKPMIKYVSLGYELGVAGELQDNDRGIKLKLDFKHTALVPDADLATKVYQDQGPVEVDQISTEILAIFDQPIIIAGIKGDNKTKYLIITAHYAMPSIAAKPAENAAKENVAEKMNVILRSFESQRGMFRNMRFKSNWTSQHYVFAGKFRPGKKPPTPVEVEGKHGLTIQDYQLDKDGRYTTTVERFVVDDATGSKTPHQAPSKYSYNGKIYRAFYSEQQANIFTDKTNIEAGRRLIKPTIFMKHIFDEDIERVLHRPESASFSETADGLWHLECTDNESEKIYEITFDPSRAFMITEMITTTKKGYYVKTQCEYKKTKEGFWHPVKGVRSFKKREPFVMNITEFVLNGPEDDYVLDMPKGTNIRDYTKDPDNPEVYRYGLAHKSYEQITSSKGLFVAGIAVDETGQPVGGVSVQVCCHKRPHGEEGKFSWTFSGEFDVLNAKTDTQGHFAIELEEDGFYNLRFSPKNHAAIIAYDIPVGTSDLKVTLPDGGTVVGRVVCIENGQKVPVPFAEVKLKQCDRASYTHLGFDRERKTKTDPDGRFRFEHVRTRMRGSKTRKSRDWGYDTFRVWELSCENVSQSVTFYEGMKIEKLELLVGELTEPLQLVGKRLSPLDNINIDFTYAETKDKPILLCFWDKNQRPSRRCLAELAKKADDLAAKGIVLIAVHSSAVEQNELDDWLTKNNISIPVGTIKADIKRTLLTWGVRGQPWLILTDRNHTVTAEGFGINELGEKISHK